MFRVVIAVLLLLAPPAGAGSPQERFHKWWLGPPAKELGLTEDQSSRIETIYQAGIPRIQTVGQDLESARKDLNTLIAGEKTTETDVIRQLLRVQAAQNEFNRQWTLMNFRFYQELRPDQRQRLRAMRDQERRGGRRGDPPQRPPQIKK